MRSTHQMYVVDANQTQYMALQLDPDRYQEAERLYEETWTYIESGSEADLPVPCRSPAVCPLWRTPTWWPTTRICLAAKFPPTR